MSKKAKLAALSKLREAMSKMGGEGYDEHKKGMMKATIMAEDEEGLKKGAEKLEEIMEAKSEMEDEYEGMSKEELIAKLRAR